MSGDRSPKLLSEGNEDAGRSRRHIARLLLLQTSVGDYRQAFLEVLRERLGADLLVCAGREYFDRSTITRVRLPGNLRMVRNLFFFNRRLLFQWGAVGAAVRARSAVLELNPRIVTVWWLLLVRRLLGRRTVLWGHAWSRRGPGSFTEPLRNAMRTLAHTVLVYTEREAEELRQRMTNKRILAAPNSLYRAEEMCPAKTEAVPESFVLCGRLVESKRPETAIRAFAMASRSLPAECKLVLVGEGPLRGALEQAAAGMGVAAKVIFRGHVGDLESLRSVYGSAVASLSPGGVGLAITQSLSFGVPMIITRNAHHGPEIEAAEEGENCILVHPGSPDEFARAMVKVFHDRATWLTRRTRIAERCKRKYSAEVMATRMIEAALGDGA